MRRISAAQHGYVLTSSDLHVGRSSWESASSAVMSGVWMFRACTVHDGRTDRLGETGPSLAISLSRLGLSAELPEVTLSDRPSSGC